MKMEQREQKHLPVTRRLMALLLCAALLLGLCPAALAQDGESGADYAALAAESWEAMVLSAPEAADLSGIQQHAQSALTQAAAEALNVSVSGENGKYAVTYMDKATSGTAFTQAHTYYADTDYTIDFSTMTAGEQTAFMNDLVQAGRETGIYQCEIVDGSLVYSSDSFGRPVSEIILPVRYSGNELVFEAEMSVGDLIIPDYSNWAAMYFGMTGLTDHYQMGIMRDTADNGIDFCREEDGSTTDGVSGPITELVGEGEGKISSDKYNGTVTKPDAVFTYKVIVKNGVAYGFIDGVQVLTADLSDTLAGSVAGNFGFGNAGPELHIKKIRISTDTSRDLPSAGGDTEELKKLASASWERLILGEPESLELSAFQVYAAQRMTAAAQEELDVSVSGENGKYTVTYTDKETSGTAFTQAHTYYADTDYTIDFSTMTADEQTAFMSDLVQAGRNTGIYQCEIVDGSLVYSSDSFGRPVSEIILPVRYSGNELVFEAEMSVGDLIIPDYSNWAAMYFGMTGLTDHYQMGIMRDTADNGIDFCREEDGSTTDGVSGPITELVGEGEGKISSDKYNGTVTKPDAVFTYKVIVKNGVAYGFIDGVHVLTADLSDTLEGSVAGNFGFGNAGPELHIKKIRISTDTSREGFDFPSSPKASFDVDLYEPATKLKTAPIVMQRADADTADVRDAQKRPSALIFDVKSVGGVLTAFDGETQLGTFQSLYKANEGTVNMGLRLHDRAAADAAAEFVKKNRVGNLWVISDDAALIDVVFAASNTVRGIVDLTQRFDAMSDLERYNAVFGHGYRNVLIPASAATPDAVLDLQERVMNVLVETDVQSEAEFYDLITSGANGILSGSYAENIAALERFTSPALSRAGVVTGHCGDLSGAASGAFEENTMKAFRSAATSGVGVIEYDVWLLTDNEVIVYHDETDELLGGTGRATVDCSWTGDLENMHYRTNGDSPTNLRELLAFVRDECLHLKMNIELKDYRNACVDRVVELLDEYGLRDRVDFVSFDYDVLMHAKSLGFATEFNEFTAPQSVYAFESDYRPVNSTWHSMKGQINTTFLEKLKHFGVAAYPWTMDTAEEMNAFYYDGYHGFTANIPHASDEYIRKVTAQVAADGTVSAQLYRLKDHKNASPEAAADFEIIAVDGDVVIDNDAHTVSGEGRIAVRYGVKIDSGRQYKTIWVYSQSVAVEAAPQPADKQALQALYDGAQAYSESDYTAESWTAFADALAQAKNVLDDENAEQADIDVARDALAAAIGALTKKPASDDRKPSRPGTSRPARPQQPEKAEFPFLDVADGSWYRDTVEYVYENGLMNGMRSDAFAPEAKMTRQMLWTVLGRLDGQKLSGQGVYDAARQWAMLAGLTDGSAPTANVTREQLAATLWRYAGKPEAEHDLSSFRDSTSVSAYARTAMQWAVQQRIITGSGDRLNPQGLASRAEIAAVLARLHAQLENA